MAHTGMYTLQGVDPVQVGAAPFDVKVVDIYNDNGDLFTPAQVAQMGGGPGGSLLLGYFSIGEAEVYRAYFSSIPKAAIGPENPEWKGNFEVAYWTAEWRGVATAYIDKVIAGGYDGVYFDVVDEYQQSWAKANAPGGAAGAEQAMADLVAYLRQYAQSKVPSFKVWANNAEELLSNNTYFNSIDGMFKENLYYSDSGSKQSSSETSYSLGQLQRMIDAHKDVIAIEYVSDPAKVADVQAKAAHDGVGYYTADIDLNGISYTGVLPGQTIHADWGDTTTTPTPTPPPPASDPVATPTPEPTPVPATPVDLVLTGTSDNDVLTGQNGNDKLSGNSGSDDLSGGAGDDWLEGGRGHDTLTGGSGLDTFVFRNASNRHSDTIVDFQPGVDKIALDHVAFANLGTPGVLADAAYWDGAGAHDRSDRIVYNPETGVITYDPDGRGSGSPVTIATVAVGTDLSHADFLVI